MMRSCKSGRDYRAGIGLEFVKICRADFGPA